METGGQEAVVMQYLALTCTNTRGLIEREYHSLGAWSPHYHTPEGSVVCLLPGYAFMPLSNWPLCDPYRRSRYRLRPLHPSGRRDWCVLSLEALRDMEEAALAYGRPEPGPARPVYKLGQRVRFIHGPFVGMEGRINSIRKETVRVLLGVRYVTTSPAFVEPVQ